MFCFVFRFAITWLQGEVINLTKSGVVCCDRIMTVSQNYAIEIQSNEGKMTHNYVHNHENYYFFTLCNYIHDPWKSFFKLFFHVVVSRWFQFTRSYHVQGVQILCFLKKFRKKYAFTVWKYWITFDSINMMKQLMIWLIILKILWYLFKCYNTIKLDFSWLGFKTVLMIIGIRQQTPRLHPHIGNRQHQCRPMFF